MAGLARPRDGWGPLLGRVASGLPADGSSSLTPAARDALGRWLDLAVEWNQKMDLTAARDPDELVDLFVADAVMLAGHASQRSWIDVGSGAGAPGLPLAVLRPDLEITLAEPREKRVAFLRTSIGALSLSNARVERSRSDAVPSASHDVAVSRATLPPDEWLAEGARISRSAVWVLLARGQAPELAGWRVALDLAYDWPLTGAERRAARYEPMPSRNDASTAR